MNRTLTAAMAALPFVLGGVAAQAAAEQKAVPTVRPQVTERQVGNTRMDVVRLPDVNLPVVIYRGVLKVSRGILGERVSGSHLKSFLNRRGWDSMTWGWRARYVAGVGRRHHHSTTSEVVAIVKGGGRLRLSGDDESQAVDVELDMGDLVFLPPGAWHQGVLEGDRGAYGKGGYPIGAPRWDWKIQLPGAEDKARIATVPRPLDPVFGDDRLHLY